MSKSMTPSEIADWHDKVDGVWHHEAAATIRELEDKLKIATEALEMVGYSMDAPTGYLLSECVEISRQALARIKEVGR